MSESVVWLILMLLTMGWLAKSRNRTRPASQRRDLVHPPSTLIVGLVSFLLLVGLPIVAGAPIETTTWWTAGYLGCVLFTVVPIAAYFVERHKVSED